jgi:hypothetical protein
MVNKCSIMGCGRKPIRHNFTELSIVAVEECVAKDMRDVLLLPSLRQMGGGSRFLTK